MAPKANTVSSSLANGNQPFMSTKTKKKKKKKKKWKPSMLPKPQNRNYNQLMNPQSKSRIGLTRKPRKRRKALKRARQQCTEPAQIKKPRLDTESTDIITVESDTDGISRDNNDGDVQLIDNADAIVVTDDDNSVIAVDSSVNDTDSSSIDDNNIVINVNQTINIGRFGGIDDAQSTAGSINSRFSDCLDFYEDVRIENEKFPHLRLHGFSKSWSNDMLKFYTEPCERTRNFDYEEVQKMMPGDPSEWRINHADRYSTGKRNRRKFVCKKCNIAGHAERNCRKFCTCSLCGQFDHLFFECPNTLCLTCGKKSWKKNVTYCQKCKTSRNANTVCGICGQMYHNDYYCPSKWRSFTTVSDLSEPMRPNQRKYCYNCAQAGHFGFECPLEHDSNYPLDNPYKTALFDVPSLESGDNGGSDRVMISISKTQSQLLHSDKGDKFLKRYVNDSNFTINLFPGVNNYVQIIGDNVTSNDFEKQLEKWMSELNEIDSD